MSVSAETYIVIALMFAVFAAFAAVGTSVVLGAGFERLRAGFEVVKSQSGFFADAIYKLDMRTQKLDEETAKLKSGMVTMGERMERTEKTTTFLADSINSIEQRILSGTPAEQGETDDVEFHPVVSSRQSVAVVEEDVWEPLQTPKSLSVPSTKSLQMEREEKPELPETPMCDDTVEENHDTAQGFTTLLSRYFSGETSGSSRSVVYH